MNYLKLLQNKTPMSSLTGVLATISLGIFLSSLDTTIVVVSLPSIGRDLGQDALLSWVMSSYLMTCSATLPIYAKISDIYGRRSVYLISLFIFLIGSVLCAVATSMWFLIVARGVQGLGAGALLSLSTTIICDVVTTAGERGKYMGLISLIFAFSSIGGPLIGGALSDAFGWRSIFYLNIPLIILCMAMSYKYITVHNPVHSHKIDYIGSILVVIFTSTLLLAISWGGDEYPWSNITIILLFLAATMALMMFLFVQWYVNEPLVSLSLVKTHNVALTSLVSLITGVCFYVVVTFLPLYYQTVHNDSAVMAGLKGIPVMVFMPVSSLSSGQFVARGYVTSRTLMIAGSFLLTLGLGLLGLVNQTMAFGYLFLYESIIGIGLGLILINTNLVSQNAVEAKYIATVNALIQFIRNLGGSIGVTIYSAIYYYFNNGDNQGYAFAITFLLLSPLFAIGIILSLCLERPIDRTVSVANPVIELAEP